MKTPTIHLNGTSAESLAQQYEHARNKVRDAIEALAHVDIHGRDYYLQGPRAYSEAVAEHCKRVDALQWVADELEVIQASIAEAL